MRMKVLTSSQIFATGFDVTQYNVELRGRDGQTRKQHWLHHGYKSTFKSIAMHGFPNFFYVLGPNSGRLHTSVLLSIERYGRGCTCGCTKSYTIPLLIDYSHVHMIMSVIGPIIRGVASSVQVKRDREERYGQTLQAELRKSVQADNPCSSVRLSSLKCADIRSPLPQKY